MWRDAFTTEQRDKAEELLRDLLIGHAKAVMYSVLRRSDDVVATEAVDKVLMNLFEFREDSLFTTWAHRILMNTMYDYRRVERKQKETPLVGEVAGYWTDGGIAYTDLIQSVRQLLSEEDYKLFELFAVQGLSFEDAEKLTGTNDTELFREWNRIKGTLQDGLSK